MTKQQYEAIKAKGGRGRHRWQNAAEYENFMAWEYHSLGYTLKPLGPETKDWGYEIWAFTKDGERLIKIGYTKKLSSETMALVQM